MSGVIFDAPAARTQLAAIEEKVSDANFWQDQEKAQGVLQHRKQIEDRVNAEDTLNRKMSDVETYFQLAEQEPTTRSARRFSKTSRKSLPPRMLTFPLSKPKLFSPVRTTA